MPGTLTIPSPSPVTEEEPALHVCVWDHVARTVAWLDADGGRGPHEIAVRVMKIAEETGEAVSAYIGLTGQNPRKGVTHTWEDVQGELCDVVITALVALRTLTPDTREVFTRHLEKVTARSLEPSAPG